MVDGSRLVIHPKVKLLNEVLTTVSRDGSDVKANLEYWEKEINLDGAKYFLHIGSTPGRKGLPNQDAAGVYIGKTDINNEIWNYILGIVSDGVSARENSDVTAKSVVSAVIRGMEKATSFKSFDVLINFIWESACIGAKEPKVGRGVTTTSLFFLAVSGNKQILKILNCGDSRAFWATEKEVNTATVHNNILTGGITFSIGNGGRDNLKVRKDIYTCYDTIQAVFLCTDTFAWITDGVYFPEKMIPTYGTAIGRLNDHLTSVLLRRL